MKMACGNNHEGQNKQREAFHSVTSVCGFKNFRVLSLPNDTTPFSLFSPTGE
jgi:hypothetical protein